jgi:hypothetical protein
VKIQFGKEKSNILYTIGVQQGDNNMAPVLFVFLMQAFAEILEQKLKGEWGINLSHSTNTSSKSKQSKATQ